MLVTSVAVAVAVFTDTFAAAVTVGLVVSLGSWAIDASEGFSAVAWLAPLSRFALGSRIAPFEHGILALEQLTALLSRTIGALALAVAGVRSRPARIALLVAAIAIALFVSARARHSFDWTEQRRASLPPEIVSALREIPTPIRIDVALDVEDSRRRELEADTLAKLRLARGDLEVTRADPSVDYGKLLIHVGDAQTSTRSTSRGEIVTLIFETAKRPIPEYSGYPVLLHDLGIGIVAVLLGHRRPKDTDVRIVHRSADDTANAL